MYNKNAKSQGPVMHHEFIFFFFILGITAATSVIVVLFYICIGTFYRMVQGMKFWPEIKRKKSK